MDLWITEQIHCNLINYSITFHKSIIKSMTPEYSNMWARVCIYTEKNDRYQSAEAIRSFCLLIHRVRWADYCNLIVLISRMRIVSFDFVNCKVY